MKDSSLQFVHWLNRAAEFNKQMKGNQMEEKTCFYCGSKATVEAYEVGKSVEQERIIKLLEELPIYKNLFDDLMIERQFKIADGSDVVWIGDAYEALDKQLLSIIALIKGEK